MKTNDVMNIPFSNDFMFCTVLYENLDLAKEFVEVITQRKVREIQHSNKQLTLDYALSAKSVRLDVYFEDDEAVYDLEMQRSENDNLAERARYYQGAIDQSILEKGNDYAKLKNSYIIFICTFDPFNKGRSKYTFQEFCVEDKSILLNNGATKIFLNATSTQNDVSKELQDLLKYIYTGTSNNNNLVQKIDEVVVSTQNNETWRDRYMTLEYEINRRVAALKKEIAEEKKNSEKILKENQTITNQLDNAIAAFMSMGLTKEEAKKLLENGPKQ